MKTNNRTKVQSLLWALLLIGAMATGHAQQDSQYTQYMYNTQIINPAYAGSRGMLSFNALYRSQWVGLDGAPETLNFSMNTPSGTKGVGLGLSFFADRIGASDESNLAADFSYTLKLSDKVRLSFGAKGGVNLLNVDYARLNIFNPTDPNFSGNIENRLSPIVGAGAYLRHSDKWYLGVSVPNFLETNHYDDIARSTASERMNFYAIAGYVFDLGREVQFKPAVLTKIISGSPIALDLSANFLFFERFTLGAAYRWDAAVNGLAGFQISDRFMLGYAYDYDTTELGNYNSGSHEFFLRFELISRSRNQVNPRFF